LFFTRYIFKENTGNKFEVAPFHVKLAETLEAVNRGEIKRLIINIPPRYGKTEIAVKMFFIPNLKFRIGMTDFCAVILNCDKVVLSLCLRQ
jgi:hypothetical protein